MKSEREDLVGFIKPFMMAASSLASRRALRGGADAWGEGAINKRKETVIFRPGHFGAGQGKGTSRVFILRVASSFCGERGMERAHVTDYLIGVDQKIPE